MFAELDTKLDLASDAEASTTVSESDFDTSSDSEQANSTCSSDSENSLNYNSCFYVPAPPRNVVRVYHNRKKTSYTDYPVECSASSRAKPVMTLVQLLFTEECPSRERVSDVALSESCAKQDGNLEDVLETPDVGGLVPLMIATRQQQVDAVEQLLSMGAKPDCQDPDTGCTPLMVAVKQGNQHIIRHLLNYGAPVHSLTGPGESDPLTEAILSRRADIIDMLLNAGGDLSLAQKRSPDLVETFLRFRRSIGERAHAKGWAVGYWSVLLGHSWHTVMPACA